MAINLTSSNLYPPIEPLRTGFLSVSDGHELYYEICGNPSGYPILFVHGGPGAGCDAKDRQFFDSRKWQIVLFDQRGSGRSRPFCSTAGNTTAHLVKDMRQLLQKLNIHRTVLFGGSWGSTLSLVYAINYPHTVSGMVLRGIYLATHVENKYYLNGGIATHFPEVWERFLNHVPLEFRDQPAEYYRRQMTSDNSARRKLFAYEWARYELSVLHLHEKPDKELDEEIQSFFYESLSILETHYILQNCFLPDNFILKNIAKIRHIPISIVQGRYDVICPPESAWQLQKALPEARLHFVCSGHSSGDPETQSKLIEETNGLFNHISS